MSESSEVYLSFVRELAACPDKVGLLDRLSSGHRAGPGGWCRHPGHEARWEQHPCSTLRLTTLTAVVDVETGS